FGGVDGAGCGASTGAAGEERSRSISSGKDEGGRCFRSATQVLCYRLGGEVQNDGNTIPGASGGRCGARGLEGVSKQADRAATRWTRQDPSPHPQKKTAASAAAFRAPKLFSQST